MRVSVVFFVSENEDEFMINLEFSSLEFSSLLYSESKDQAPSFRLLGASCSLRACLAWVRTAGHGVETLLQDVALRPFHKATTAAHTIQARACLAFPHLLQHYRSFILVFLEPETKRTACYS